VLIINTRGRVDTACADASQLCLRWDVGQGMQFRRNARGAARLKARGMAITARVPEPRRYRALALHQIAGLTAVQSFPEGTITSAASTDSPCSYDVQESTREDAIVSRFCTQLRLHAAECFRHTRLQNR
jgi:hypothetical protein